MSLETIWYTRCPVPTAFSIALQLGWLDAEFASDGIVLRSLASSTEASVRQSHFSHSQANSVRHGGAIPPLLARQRGSDLRIVGLSVSGFTQRVLALKESGIRNVRDLAGKRLGIPCRINDPIDFARATALRGFDLALKQGGLLAGDVLLVDVKEERRFVDDTTPDTGRSATLWDASSNFGFQRAAAFALLRGEVDAIFAHGASSVTLQSFLGATVVAEWDLSDDLASTVNNQPFPLTVSGTLVDDRPDVVARLVARVREAAAWAREHEREAKRIIASETGLPEEIVDRAFGPNVHAQLDIDLAPRLVNALQALHDDVLLRGFLHVPVDLEAFIDRRPLQAAQALPKSAMVAAA